MCLIFVVFYIHSSTVVYRGRGGGVLRGLSYYFPRFQYLPYSERCSSNNRSKIKWSLPDLKWSLPDSKWSLPDLKWSLPDLKWSLPDLKWSLPDSKWSLPGCLECTPCQTA